MQLEGSVSTTSSAIWRFFQTPKGILIIVLVILVAVAAPHEGIALVAPGLATAVLFATSQALLVVLRAVEEGRQAYGNRKAGKSASQTTPPEAFPQESDAPHSVAEGLPPPTTAYITNPR